MSLSHYLDKQQLKALQRIGDFMIPGDFELLSFSTSGCISEIDRILNFMPVEDLNDLKKLLSVAAKLPRFFLHAFLWFLEWNLVFPGLGIFRMIRLGLRGLVMSLYFSHPQVLHTLGYQVHVHIF